MEKSDEMTARATVHSGRVHNQPLIKLSRKTCLKCHEGDNVLVCNGDCPIVVHESCISSGARFDDNGNFCCPYCFYKQSIVDFCRANEKALLAKKTLSIWLDINTTKNCGNLQNSKSLKGKEPDLPTNMQSKIYGSGSKVETDKTGYQPMQVEGGQKDERSELETVNGNQEEAGLPMSTYCMEKETAAKEDENRTNMPQETITTVEPYQSIVKDPTRAKQDIILTRVDDPTYIYEESDKRNESTLQDDYDLKSQMVPESKNIKQPAGVDYCGKTDGRIAQVKSLKNAIHPTVKDSAILTHVESGTLTKKHLEIVKAVRRYGNDGFKKQAEDQDTYVCLTRKNDTTEIHELFDNGNDCTSNDSYVLRTQMTLNLDDTDHPGTIGEDDCKRENKGESQVKSLRTVRMEAVNFPKCPKIAKMVEGYGDVEKKLIQAEPPDPSACLTRKENTMQVHKEYDKGSDCTYHDGSFLRIQTIVNSKNADQPAERGEDSCRMPDEEKTQPVLESALVTDEVSEDGDNSASSQNGYGTGHGIHSKGKSKMPVNLKNANQHGKVCDSSETELSELDGEPGEGRCRMPDEEKTQPIMNSAFVIDEVSEDGDNSASSQDGYGTWHGNYSKGKRKMPENLKNANQSGEVCDSSETELSELEEVTCGKSRQKRDLVNHSQCPALLSARRRKLPWTVEEVDILKEGVQKFSLLTNKNLPWMKILEFGRHIFDGTRSPVDLKDKWKNLQQ